jgi:4-amino-4-deoxy-L-arabinose transferase-like glycosyltransferase
LLNLSVNQALEDPVIDEPASGSSASGVMARAASWVAANRIITVLLLLAAVKGMIWAVAIPPWRTPDEPQHFSYIQLFSRDHRLPRGDEAYVYPDVLSSMGSTNFMGIWGEEVTPVDTSNLQINPAANHPPLYYLLMFPAYRLALGGSVETQLYAVRIWGTAIFLLLILVSWRLARLVFPRALYLQIAIPLMMILHPQLGFISAGVSNETLTTLLFTFWLLQVVLMARGDLSVRRAGILGIVTGLGMMTKFTFVVAYPLLAAVLVVMALKGRHNRTLLAGLARTAAIVGGVSLIICGWYVLWNIAHRPPPLPGEKVERYGQIGLLELIFSTRFPVDLFNSFMGTFSWMSIPLPEALFTWLRRLAWLAAFGVAAMFALNRWQHRRSVIAGWLAVLMAGFLLVMFIFAAVFEINVGAAQGRYLFPAIFPFWALLLAGLTGWLPAAWRPRAVAAIVAAGALFSTWTLLAEFLPRVT